MKDHQSKNSNTNQLRFRAERVYEGWAILDVQELRFEMLPAGTTREQAHQAAAARNATTTPRERDRPHDARILDQEFRTIGVTPERIKDHRRRGDGYADIYVHPVPPLSAADALRVARWTDWLPQLVRAWADVVRPQLRIGTGPRHQFLLRSQFVIQEILNRAATDFRFADLLLEDFHFHIWPNVEMHDMADDEYEDRIMVSLHNLSTDSHAVKRAFFDSEMTERTYQRTLATALAALAERVVRG